MFIAPSDLKLLKMSRTSSSVLPTSIAVSPRQLSKRKVIDGQTYFNVYTSPYEHGKDYQNLADANPYANVPYRESWWQRALTSMGFRTGKDAYLENMALQAAEYDNALMQKEYNEKYDSPIQQAARERAAGLNPNLTGNVSAGESAEMTEDGNPPQASADDLGSLTQFASGIMDCVQIAYGLFGNGISLASGIADLKGKVIDNQAKEISTTNNLFDFAEDAVVRLRDVGDSYQPGVSIENIYPALKKHYGNVMSKKQFRKFASLAQSFNDKINVDDKYFERLKRRTENRKSYYQTAFNSAEYSEMDEVMAVVSDELGKLATNSLKSKLGAETSKANYDKEFYENLNPERMADAQQVRAINDATQSAYGVDISKTESSLKRNEKEMSDFKLELRTTLRNLMHRLDGLIGDGNDFGSAVKAAIAGWVLKNLPTM